MLRLVLYGKARCSLCDHARELVEDVLDDLHGQVAAALDEIDIRSDDALYARYRYDVPVLTLDGRELFRHRVEPDRLRELLLGKETAA
jgi:hypothetical protein